MLALSLFIGMFARAQSAPGSVAAPAEQVEHHVSKPGTGDQPVTTAEMMMRIHESADRYLEYAPIPRVAFMDDVFPRDTTEMKGMAGYALLVITAFSQETDELPLKRVYISRNGQVTELKRLAEVSSVVSIEELRIRAVFGIHRSDALFLLPVAAATSHASLFIDFAAGRDAFKLADLGGPSFGPFQKWSRQPGNADQIDLKALAAFVQREYPGFFERCTDWCGGAPAASSSP